MTASSRDESREIDVSFRPASRKEKYANTYMEIGERGKRGRRRGGRCCVWRRSEGERGEALYEDKAGANGGCSNVTETPPLTQTQAGQRYNTGRHRHRGTLREKADNEVVLTKKNTLRIITRCGGMALYKHLGGDLEASSLPAESSLHGPRARTGDINMTVAQQLSGTGSTMSVEAARRPDNQGYDPGFRPVEA